MTAHKVHIGWQAAWNEYRATCSCGWTGSYFSRAASAEREANAHVAAAERERGAGK